MQRTDAIKSNLERFCTHSNVQDFQFPGLDLIFMAMSSVTGDFRWHVQNMTHYYEIYVSRHVFNKVLCWFLSWTTIYCRNILLSCFIIFLFLFHFVLLRKSIIEFNQFFYIQYICIGLIIDVRFRISWYWLGCNSGNVGMWYFCMGIFFYCKI